MTSRSQAEREAFFRDLGRLDESEDDEEPESHQPMAVSSVLPATSVKSAPRRAVKVDATKPPSLATSSTAPEPITASKPHNILRRARGSKAKPPALQRSRSDGAASGRVKKSAAKGKKTKVPPPIPEDKQLFRNLKFFFIPNHDSALVRRLRIDFAEQHGAKWIRQWDESVTHILVDRKLPFSEYVKDLPSKTLPHGIPLISDEWVSACHNGKMLLDIDQKRFLLDGMQSPFEKEGENQQDNMTAYQRSKKSSGGRLPAIETPSKDREAYELPDSGNASLGLRRDEVNADGDASVGQSDELGRLISKMQGTNYLALEDLIRHDPSFEFEDDFILDPDEVKGAKTKWQCMKKTDQGKKDENPNACTISLLEQMAAVHERQGEIWRCQAFRNAAAGLKQQRTYIRTKEEAMAIDNIGESIAEKIEEIASTGSFGRLENIRSDPYYQVVELFRGIYGVGVAQAKSWATAGYKTLEQLLNSGQLSSNQKVGIDHYEDFQTRIPRDEVTQHGLMVARALKAADPALEFVIGGSYRRGSADSGDIDVMITKKDAELEYLQRVIQDEVVPSLKRDGFIVAELAASNDTNSSKWMGASVLPGMTTWRRLDLLYVPWVERGAARLYWTGNDIFNRSLRLLASRKGMRLNQRGLFENTMRGPGRIKITEGKRIAGESEKEIFDILGVPYRPPHHRNP